MDFYYPGMETDPQNAQVLGDPGSGKWQGKIGGVPDSASSVLPAAAEDNRWLMLKGFARDGVVDHWDKLKISEGDWSFQSPKKREDLKNKSTLSSPVSTLACWSPQATLAPPFKFRRSEDMITL